MKRNCERKEKERKDSAKQKENQIVEVSSLADIKKTVKGNDSLCASKLIAPRPRFTKREL